MDAQSRRNEMMLSHVLCFFHYCADYGTIYGDLSWYDILALPYYEHFAYGYVLSEDTIALLNSGEIEPTLEMRLCQEGAVLLFMGLLTDWEDGSGYPFGTYDGICRHPLPVYLTYLLDAYEQVRAQPASRMRELYAAALMLLAELDRRKDLAHVNTLDHALVERVRRVIQEDHLAVSQLDLANIEAGIYEKYIRAYFIERASEEPGYVRTPTS